MRLTTRTNLAIRALMFCAVNPQTIVRKSDIAKACNASENHLAQVVRLLAHHDFIDAERGRIGGIRLARQAHEINIGAVFRLFEAELPFAECLGPSNSCPLTGVCWLKTAIQDAVKAFYASLDKVTLANLVDGNAPLAALLHMRGRTTCSHRTAHARAMPEAM